MATENELAVVLGVPAAVLKALTPVQQGWLNLAQQKTKTFADLQKAELEVQGKLKGIAEKTDLIEVQELIKVSKNIAATSKEQRLHFTGMITDRLFVPAMEFEKRSEALIADAAKHELELRKAAAQKEAAEADKNKEVAGFKAHIENEQLRIASAYRIALQGYITDAYTDCLKASRAPKEIPAFLQTVKKFMSEHALSPFQKYTRLIITDDEARAIWAEAKKYAPEADLLDAHRELDAKFQMYDQDLENAGKAIKAAEKEAADKAKEEAEQLEQDRAINTLASEATLSAPVTGAKTKLNKKYVVVVENSEDWALNVMRAFISKWGSCREELKNRTWEKLTIGQMAAAVGALYTKDNKLVFTGLKMSEVVK